MIHMYQAAAALRTFFEPRELKTYEGHEVTPGFAWSVICEPHDHWRVRVALKHDESLCVSVSHPGEGTTLEREFAAGFNFGEVLGPIGSAVPVKV